MAMQNELNSFRNTKGLTMVGRSFTIIQLLVSLFTIIKDGPD